MEGLTIVKFNEILFGALEKQTPEEKIEILEKEIELAAGLLFDEMGELMDELEEKGYESKRFTKAKNIAHSMMKMSEQEEMLKKEIEERGKENE